MKSKKCGKCKQIKPLIDFHNKKNSKDGRSSECKLCVCARRRQNYHTPEGKAKNDAYGQANREANRKLMFEFLLSCSCINCGETNPIVLEFDHKNPSDKSFTIGGRGYLFRSWKNVLKEIEKCEVRCANCHKIKTAEQFGWSRHSLYEEWKVSQGLDTAPVVVDTVVPVV